MINLKRCLFLLITLSVFTACEKDKTDATDCSLSLNEISDSEIASVGELHNEYVIKAFEEFDYSTPLKHYDEEFKRTYEEMISDDNIVSLSFPDFEPIELEEYRDLFCNYESVSSYYDRLMSNIERYHNIVSLNQEISKLESEAKVELIDFDRLFILSTISVAKNSAELWYSFVDPNSGLPFMESIHNRINEYHPHQHPKRFSAQDIVKSDAEGGASYFLGLGFGAAFLGVIPGTNGAILGGAAFSAGWASAMAMLYNCEP